MCMWMFAFFASETAFVTSKAHSKHVSNSRLSSALKRPRLDLNSDLMLVNVVP